jgi:DNA-nicking Smr family endonuclease
VTRRTTTPEEKDEFAAAFAETRPLVSKKTVAPIAKRSVTLSATEGGLDGKTDEKLRRGLIEPQSKLDLHGLTEAAAHQALLGFLKSARTRGAKLVLVVTGRGPKNDETAPFNLGFDRGPRGVLKAAVPRWLKEPEFAALVAGARSAHRRHGGEGAIYIYLRRTRG